MGRTYLSDLARKSVLDGGEVPLIPCFDGWLAPPAGDLWQLPTQSLSSTASMIGFSRPTILFYSLILLRKHV